MFTKAIILSSFFFLTFLTGNAPDVSDAETCQQKVIANAAHTLEPASGIVVTATFYEGEIIPSVMLHEVVITPEKEAGTLVRAARVGDHFIPTVLLDEVVIRPM